MMNEAKKGIPHKLQRSLRIIKVTCIKESLKEEDQEWSYVEIVMFLLIAIPFFAVVCGSIYTRWYPQPPPEARQEEI